MFHDIILFAGDKRFVDLDLPRGDGAVDQNLVAQRKHQEIALHDIRGGDLTGLAISDDRRLLLGLEAHFVNGFLGTNFVDDAD